MPEAVEECIDHTLGLKDVVPVLERQVGGDDCWSTCFVAFFHEFEEAVHLLEIKPVPLVESKFP